MFGLRKDASDGANQETGASLISFSESSRVVQGGSHRRGPRAVERTGMLRNWRTLGKWASHVDQTGVDACCCLDGQLRVGEQL